MMNLSSKLIYVTPVNILHTKYMFFIKHSIAMAKHYQQLHVNFLNTLVYETLVCFQLVTILFVLIRAYVDF